eukprot:Skav217374  [mRNA]  locus=scaffold5994:41102:42319:- [translate_table: standard]
MMHELGVDQYCGQKPSDNTCLAIQAAIAASRALKAKGVKPRFANFAITRWGKYPSWTEGSVTIEEPDSPNQPAVATVHDAAGVVGYGVCNILRNILTHSVNQYGTGTCGHVAVLSSLSWSAPAQAIKMGIRLFWTGTMLQSFKVCENIYALQPGLAPLGNDYVDKPKKDLGDIQVCQADCDETVSKLGPMLSAGLTAMWTFAQISHVKEVQSCPSPSKSILQVMYPGIEVEEPAKRLKFFKDELASQYDVEKLCQELISPSCKQQEDFTKYKKSEEEWKTTTQEWKDGIYKMMEGELDQACAAVENGGVALMGVHGSVGLDPASEEAQNPGVKVNGEWVTDQGVGSGPSHFVYLQSCDQVNDTYTIWSWAKVKFVTKRNLIGTPDKQDKILWGFVLADKVHIFDD